MSIKEVNSALVKGYQALGLTVPVAFETVSFTPPPSGEYAELFNLPSDLAPVTLGDSGMDRYNGIFQINFNVPEKGGSGKLHDWADLTRQYFKAGKTLVHNTQKVHIQRAVPSSIRKSDKTAGWVISMSVYWYADMSRA